MPKSSTKATRTSGRIAKENATKTIRRNQKAQYNRKRLVLYPDTTVVPVIDLSACKKHFPSNIHKEALLIKTFALSDGTYARMYAMHDYETDLDYILNEKASQFVLGFLLKLEDDWENLELIYGPVLYTRVDEDGEEIGFGREHWQDLQEVYL